MDGIEGLIPESGKAILREASEVKAIADGAVLASSIASVANLINNAANTGAYSIKVNYPLSDDVIGVLTDNGYLVVPVGNAKVDDLYLVSWE